MTSTSDWGSIIDEVKSRRFVGRKQELDTFRQQISLNKPNYLIFYITGQGGVGKTTLLNRYRKIAQDAGFLLGDCDEQEHDVPTVLGRFAHQLAKQGSHLKRFDERYKIYRQKMNEIENDPDAPQGLAAMLGRTIVRATFAVGDAVPGLRKGLEFLPQEPLETQASEWVSYLTKKLTNKDEIVLIRDPVPILTSLFFDDLNELARKQRILLCFENFEATRQELQGWLLRLREYRPSFNIRLAIAGRNQPGPQWDALRSVTMTVRLDVFTEREAQACLDTYGIINTERRREILECSGRLPVIMSWLAAPEGNELDTSLPTQSIVERFLRWVTEPNLRQEALLGAIPRLFNLDILAVLLDSQGQSGNGQAAFDWLLTMPFVQQSSNGWRYHEVVRSMMLHYQRQKSPQAYRQLHTVLADFYNKRRNELHCSSYEQWINEQWRRDTLAYTYHFLAADTTQHWMSAMDLFAIAVRKHRSFATEIVEMLTMSDVQDDLSREQCATVQLFHQQLQAIKDKDLQAGFEMFDRLCAISGLSSQAKGHILTYRGECHRLSGKWEKALRDFGDALQYLPGDVRTLIRRGITYILMEDYQKAINDLNQAIALDEEDTWALAIRGEAYRRMKQFQEALSDLNQAIALDEKNAWALAIRGEAHRRMKQHQEALSDLNQAILLDGQNTWAIAVRGATYYRMERYEEALADLNQVLALDDKNIWAIVNRGEIYCRMGNDLAALADLQHAIVLDEKYARTLASPELTYLLTTDPFPPSPKLSKPRDLSDTKQDYDTTKNSFLTCSPLDLDTMPPMPSIQHAHPPYPLVHISYPGSAPPQDATPPTIPYNPSNPSPTQIPLEPQWGGYELELPETPMPPIELSPKRSGSRLALTLGLVILVLLSLILIGGFVAFINQHP